MRHLRSLLAITLVALTTLACAHSPAPWEITGEQMRTETVLLAAAREGGTFGVRNLCVPTAERVRAATGATIHAVEGHYGERHAIACLDGVCVDNGLLSKDSRGNRRAFLLAHMDRYWTDKGVWACADGAKACAINGEQWTAGRGYEPG